MAVNIDLMGDVYDHNNCDAKAGVINSNTPPSASQFLTDNARDTNKNRKFATTSPTATLLNRLGYNFDPADDTILQLSPEVLDQLRRMPRLFKDWQAEDIRNGNVGSYYRNPVGDSVTTINRVLEEIKTKILISPGGETVFTGEDSYITQPVYVSPLEPIYTEANFASAEGPEFLSHTNRLSNVEELNFENANSPHYIQCSGLAKILTFMCYQVDGTETAEPSIGFFTSLLVAEEINAFKNTIITYPSLIENSIEVITVVVFTGEDSYETSTKVSNLSSAQIESMVNTIRSIKILFQSRRTHDENYYRKALDITKEQKIFTNMNRGGEFDELLINDFIGTQKLKESRNIADNPPPYERKIIVSEFGHVTVYNNTTGEIVESDDDIIDILRTPREDDVIIKTVFEQGDPPIPSEFDSEALVLTLDDFIEQYNTNVLTVNVGTEQLNVNTGSIIFKTNNGVRSNTRIVKITNVGDNTYYYTGTATVSNFLNSEVDVIVENIIKSRPIKTVTIANTGTGYSNGTIVITGGGTDNVPATIKANVNAITGAITSLNIVSVGSYTTRPTLNVTTLGGTSANLIAILEDPINSILTGESFNVSVGFTSLSSGNTVDYGLITINPGIEIRVKGYSNVSTSGILLPNSGSLVVNVGNTDYRPKINVFNGPYAIVDSSATGIEKWTFRNLSNNDVTILSVIETTNSLSTNGNTHMNVQLYQANTPNTLSKNETVLWYANVKPLVVFPNASTFVVTTSDGQQRTLTIGIDYGLVDESNLYNEVVNSNPDIITTTASFRIRVYGGKANTRYTYTGPNISGFGYIKPNGYATIANTSITNVGSYTYTINFEGTNHRRTLTKVIST